MSVPTNKTATGELTPDIEKTDLAQTQPLLNGGKGLAGADMPPANRGEKSEDDRYLPLVLQPAVPALLCAVMILGGMGLEVAFYFSQKNKGWWTPADSATSILHYVYTYPPVLVAMIIIAVWTAMDQEIMKLQPYVDLSRGGADANTSLLLDYTNHPKFIVWIYQTKNRHTLALLSTLTLLMLLASQPLCASLFTIRDTEFIRKNINVPRFGVVGLNEAYSTLEGFASAAGFVEAQARYGLERPPFVWQAWAVDEFERPTSFISNGTLQANTTAIQTQPNCRLADISSYTSGNITASSAGCRFQQGIDTNSVNTYGVKTADNCDDYTLMSKNSDIRPVFFWFSSKAAGNQQSAVVYCAPTLSLHYVTISINLANGSLTNVNPTGNYEDHGKLTDGGPPLYGGIWNGVDFNLSNPSAIVSQRANTTRLQLPAAVFVTAQESDNGLSAAFNTPQNWANLTTTVYRTFLALSARTNYFVKDTTGATFPTDITEIQKRVWLSPIAVHILAVVLIVGGVGGMFIHYLHYQLRKGVRLYAQPGTIASAASITADSGLNTLVRPGYSGEQIREALRGRKFMVDNTGRVLLQGEHGFESAKQLDKRGSVYGALMRAAR